MARKSEVIKNLKEQVERLTRIIKTDIRDLYGVMAIVLVRDRGWKPKTAVSLINSIQNEWNDVATNPFDNAYKRCLRVTGIDIEQGAYVGGEEE